MLHLWMQKSYASILSGKFKYYLYVGFSYVMERII